MYIPFFSYIRATVLESFCFVSVCNSTLFVYVVFMLCSLREVPCFDELDVVLLVVNSMLVILTGPGKVGCVRWLLWLTGVCGETFPVAV
jgi:hypothetical protein